MQTRLPCLQSLMAGNQSERAFNSPEAIVMQNKSYYGMLITG